MVEKERLQQLEKKKPGFFGHLAISRPGAGYRTDKPGTSFLIIPDSMKLSKATSVVSRVQEPT